LYKEDPLTTEDYIAGKGPKVEALEQKNMAFDVLANDPVAAKKKAKATFQAKFGPDLSIKSINHQGRWQLLIYAETKKDAEATRVRAINSLAPRVRMIPRN
jgi:hypothetical protein